MRLQPRCSDSLETAQIDRYFCVDRGTKRIPTTKFLKSAMSRMRFRRNLIFVATLLVWAISGLAQTPAAETPAAQTPAVQATTTPAPGVDAPQPQAAETVPQKSSAEIVAEAKKQKMLGVVPMYGVTNYQYAPALTQGQKFDLMIRGYAGPFPYLAAGFQAGLSQAFDNFEGYGQGASGYGKRFGASLLDGFNSGFFSNYLYPVIFKQDPRYFRLGEGSKKRRIVYAMEQEFVTKRDSDRKRVFSYSNVLGAFTAGGISNAYYPQEERGFGLTMSRTAVSFAWGSVGNLVLEFWPEISHAVRHTRKADVVTVK